jgi:hypothetical protein
MQMRSQCTIAIAVSAAAACTGNPVVATISNTSTPRDAPDLSLREVAFARLSEGRVVARGTAEHVDYRRAGGRVLATDGDATMVPEARSGLAPFGTLHFTAPHADGEIANRRGTAWGGVALDTGRGDRAVTEAAAFDDAVLHSESHVTAHGPGYRVEGNGLVASADGNSIRLTRGVQGQMQMEAER